MDETLKVTIEDDGKSVEVDSEPPEADTDIVIELNTMTNGLVQFISEKIEGCFESLVLTSDKPAKINITSELGYSIFNVQEYIGTTYICVRTQDWNEDGHQIGFSVSPFHLNEKLIFTVEGQQNTSVRLILRVE